MSWLQSRPMSPTRWKWIGVIALGVIGVLAFIVAILWLSEPIHELPAFLGGKKGHGHYQRRGEALIVFAIVVLAVAGYLGYRLSRSSRTDAAPAVPAAPTAPAAPAATDSSTLLAAPSTPAAPTSEATSSETPTAPPSETATEPQ